MQWQSTLDFAKFVNRKSLYLEEEQHILYDVLPTSFFNDIQSMFDKHFVI